ncbi:MAG: hypothetical protein COA36_04580 [Desulfotalea sp.]|nr:MAG: hypothetical protein COA36_04580 [Desulfotalea sp.]
MEEKNVIVETEVDAKKETCQREDAWDLVHKAGKLVVASGQKTLEYDPRSADKEEVLKKITGRTGNLRAPTLRIGDTYYVGFNVGMYESLFV